MSVKIVREGIEIRVGIIEDDVVLGVSIDEGAIEQFRVPVASAIELASSLMEAAMEASGMTDLASVLRAVGRPGSRTPEDDIEVS
jgi:hypothetical protein